MNNPLMFCFRGVLLWQFTRNNATTIQLQSIISSFPIHLLLAQ